VGVVGGGGVGGGVGVGVCVWHVHVRVRSCMLTGVIKPRRHEGKGNTGRFTWGGGGHFNL
jgi:hypothetical protein